MRPESLHCRTHVLFQPEPGARDIDGPGGGALYQSGIIPMYFNALMGTFDDNARAQGAGMHWRRIGFELQPAEGDIGFMRSIERIALAADGREATMRIEMRLAPTLWRERNEPATPAVIDAAGRRASYRFTWFGAEMHQEAERSGDGTTVTLTQVTDFSRGVQVLRRRDKK